MKFIEASIVMPLTILIVSALIVSMLGIFSSLKENIKIHDEEIKACYEKSEALEIRLYDAAKGIVKR